MAGKARMRSVDPSIKDFMQSDPGVGLEHIPYTDLGWHVDSPEETGSLPMHSSACDEACLEIRPLIDSLLLAIILSSIPLEEASSALSRAKRALGLAQNALGKRGRPSSIDDFYIREIAGRYHYETYRDVKRNVDLDTIIKSVIQEGIGQGVEWTSRDHNKLDRLREKFKRDRDRYLSSVNTEDLNQREPKLRAARRILRDLQLIGVHVDLKHLDPALLEAKVRQSG